MFTQFQVVPTIDLILLDGAGSIKLGHVPDAVHAPYAAQDATGRWHRGETYSEAIFAAQDAMNYVHIAETEAM